MRAAKMKVTSKIRINDLCWGLLSYGGEINKQDEGKKYIDSCAVRIMENKNKSSPVAALQ